ncbi:MAG: GNAT family protein [Novosphingobium sp.]
MSEPLLVTRRLELWQPRAADRLALGELTRPEAVRRFLGAAQSEADQFERFARNAGSWWLYGYGAFIVREHGQAAVVGNIGVFHTWRGFGEGLDDTPEAGWILAETHWGKGFAAEAMRAALAWFDALHGAQRIACMIAIDNVRSLRLAEKLGFSRYAEAEHDGEALVLLERRSV